PKEASLAQGVARALAQERLRSARLLNLLRLVGVSLFLAILICQVCAAHPHADLRAVRLLAGFWLVSIALAAGGHFSDRLARVGSLAIPFVDIPLVFVAQLWGMSNSTDPRAVADFTLGIYVFLMMLATMALRGWPLLAAATIAMLLEHRLQAVA